MPDNIYTLNSFNLKSSLLFMELKWRNTVFWLMFLTEFKVLTVIKTLKIMEVTPHADIVPDPRLSFHVDQSSGSN